MVANDLAKVGARVQFPSRALEVHTAMLHWSAKPRVMGSSPIVLIGRDVAQSVEQDKKCISFCSIGVVVNISALQAGVPGSSPGWSSMVLSTNG